MVLVELNRDSFSCGKVFVLFMILIFFVFVVVDLWLVDGKVI